MFESRRGRQLNKRAVVAEKVTTALSYLPMAWGGDGVVERARLENELGVKAHVGSNPTLPANHYSPTNQSFSILNTQSNFSVLLIVVLQINTQIYCYVNYIN